MFVHPLQPVIHKENVGPKAMREFPLGRGEHSSTRRNTEEGKGLRAGTGAHGQQTAPIPLLPRVCTAPGVTTGHSFHITSPTFPVTQNIHLSASPVIWLIHSQTDSVKDAANSHQQLQNIRHSEKNQNFQRRIFTDSPITVNHWKTYLKENRNMKMFHP